MFIIFFLFLVSPFYFYFVIFYGLTHHPPRAARNPQPATRLPATRYPLPVTRHLRKSPADFCSGLRLYRLYVKRKTNLRPGP